jgi:hypothetical protein
MEAGDCGDPVARGGDFGGAWVFGTWLCKLSISGCTDGHSCTTAVQVAGVCGPMMAGFIYVECGRVKSRIDSTLRSGRLRIVIGHALREA